MKNIISLVLIAVSVGAFFFYVDPQYREIRVLMSEVSRYDEALSQVKNLSDKRDSLLETSVRFSQKDLDKLKKMIPENVDNVKLVMDIDGIASKYGIVIGGIKIGKTASTNSNEAPSMTAVSSSKPYNEINMTFSFRATQDKFVNFLKDLEKSVRITDVDGIALRADDATGVNNYEMSIKTYWVK